MFSWHFQAFTALLGTDFENYVNLHQGKEEKFTKIMVQYTCTLSLQFWKESSKHITCIFGKNTGTGKYCLKRSSDTLGYTVISTKNYWHFQDKNLVLVTRKNLASTGIVTVFLWQCQKRLSMKEKQELERNASDCFSYGLTVKSFLDAWCMVLCNPVKFQVMNHAWTHYL